MKEKYLDFKTNDNYELINEPANVIKNGGLVLFPTETVYGIGANGLDENAIKKIFIAKGRPQDNPLILHISDMDMLDIIADEISELEYKLMDTFWPGPFTIILKKKVIVPSTVTAGLDTVAVRMPSNKIAHELINQAGVPIAAPSANISGKPSGTNVEDIFDELRDRVDYIIDGGDCEIGLESTVVRVVEGKPHILRPGKITKELIEQVAESVEVDSHVMNELKDGEVVMSPGMKHRHYAPNTKCVLVYSENNEKLIEKIKEMASRYSNPLILSTTENKNKYTVENIIDIGSKNNLEEISKNIFTDLRKVDSYNADIVIIEGVSTDGLGLAIMNRLIRACEYNFIKC